MPRVVKVAVLPPKLRGARRTMPAQKPTESKQDYGTPWEFIHAVEERFGRLDVDLAGTKKNKKAPIVYSLEDGQDSLTIPWADKRDDQKWLNPPFDNIGAFAAKCALEGAKLRRGRIFFLTPASIGSVWFATHVKPHAYVLGLSPRLIFEGEAQGYPKDLMLSIFGAGVLPGFGTWRWK